MDQINKDDRQESDQSKSLGRSRRIAHVLSIAGSDPSGGAGIQADLKTFSARGTYGLATLTALTAQNTRGVSDIHTVPADFVAAQISAIFDDIRVDAVKIGMIATADIARAVAATLAPFPEVPVVLDPVMVAKGGARLLEPDAVSVLREELLSMATVITPNLPEAADLLGVSEARNRADMEGQARALQSLGAQCVFLKGGHLGGAQSPDLFFDGGGARWLSSERVNTGNTHGTGCTLSSAIAAELAKGANASAATAAAKAYVTGALTAASDLNVGSGIGPTHHFYDLWSRL